MKTQKYYPLFVLLVLLSILLSACGSSGNSVGEDGTLQGTITISGAFALYPMMTRWAEEFQKIHPDVQFDISAGGAGKGMTDAVSGAVDIGMVSRGIKPEEEAQGAYGVAVTKDAVFPVVNANNPVAAEILAQGISQETFIKIYITGEITTWGQVVGKPEITDEIHVYTRSDAAGAPEMWAKFTGDKKQEDLLGIGVNADPGVLEAVIKDPLGIGYNNLGYAFELASGNPVAGALIVPIDLNNDGQADDDERIETMPEAIAAVASGKYPSPPARPLNVVTKGKPTGLVQTFILWILTDGQAFVGEAGYVQLTPEQLAASLEQVK
ncbi:MAG: phosphate ABC transporter substrate-binding protein [Chloroflexi bacterium HGW-Chloroflexi-6]|nr:MAG: phosphate ABC transporter substrate-binding protein [Chloroflexi bacterium HGW-Chloroflexi-6]